MAYSVRPPSRSTGESSPQVDRANAGRGMVTLGRQVAGKLNQGDLNRLNRQVPGNNEDAVVKVTFPVANRDIFVSHKLGFKVNNVEVINPGRVPCNITPGSKPASIYGMYLRSDVAGVTVTVRMFGQRVQGRG